MKQLAQGHTALNRQSWDSNSGLCCFKFYALSNAPSMTLRGDRMRLALTTVRLIPD